MFACVCVRGGGGVEDVIYFYNVKECISGNVFRSMEFQDTRFYFVRQKLKLKCYNKKVGCSQTIETSSCFFGQLNR